MHVFINGRFLPEEQATVSVFDRGYLYGDGLFETILVLNHSPFRWEQHMRRLEAGAAYLNIGLPFTRHALREAASALIDINHLPNALLRLTLSRGVGSRGYSPRGAHKPTLVLTLHRTTAPDRHICPQWRLVTSSVRLPAAQRLAQFKTCNKLPQILARSEAEAAGAQEALLLNTAGAVVEATSSNLFWIAGGSVCTPPLESGILAGITRGLVAEICESIRVPLVETRIMPDQLRSAEGVFLSLSSVGIAEAVVLDGKPLRQSALTHRIRNVFLEVLHEETGWGVADVV